MASTVVAALPVASLTGTTGEGDAMRNLPATNRAWLNGAPVLTVNGEPLPMPACVVGRQQASNKKLIRALFNAGIGTWAVSHELYSDEPAAPQTSIEMCKAVHAAAPEAYILLETFLRPSPRWLIANPDECYLNARGEALVRERPGGNSLEEFIPLPARTCEEAIEKHGDTEYWTNVYGYREQSAFSTKFVSDMMKPVLDCLDTLLLRPVGSRVCAVFLEAYKTREWNIGSPPPDHSPAALKQFRAWLKRKYPTNATLHAAWGTSEFSLHNALPPVRRHVFEFGDLRWNDPRLIDYMEAEAHALASQFLAAARLVKERYPHLLVGGFLAGGGSHHGEFLRVAADPNVDFLATPIGYDNRHCGGGVASQSPFASSLALFGKVWWDELDTRTHLAPDSEKRYGRARHEAESVELLWRDAGQTLVNRRHGWWRDFEGRGTGGRTDLVMAPSWHATPLLLAEHRKITVTFSQLSEYDRTPTAEIFAFCPVGAGRHLRGLIVHRQRYVEWSRVGASIETYALEDLLEGRVKPGKFNIVYGAQALDDTNIKGLRGLLRGSGAAVLWLQGAGLVGERGRLMPDEARCSKLTGIQQSLFRWNEETFEVVVADAASRWTREWKPGSRIGQPQFPMFSGFADVGADKPGPAYRVPLSFNLRVDDPEAVVLGHYAHSQAPCFAVKKCDGWTSIVLNAPVANSHVIRALARQAGCHIYAENDDMAYACRGLLLLHTSYDGKHSLAAPAVCRWTNLRTGEVAAEAKQQLEFESSAGKTWLFKLETLSSP